jgi:FkbM family methyltransferase
VSRNGIFHTRIEGGVDIQFRAHTPEELRDIEVRFLTERDFLQVLTSGLRLGDVFLDVGSYIGLFTIPVAKAVGEHGQVIAFEPESNNHKRLVDNVKLNGLRNVRVFRKALGERSGGGKLFLAGSGSSLLAHAGDADQQSASEAVEIAAWDELRQIEGLPVPRAVKIDVEGYEYAVLRGMQRTLAQQACQLLCVEIHPSFLPGNLRPEDVIGLVESLGFTRFEIYPRLTTTHLVASKGEGAHGPP